MCVDILLTWKADTLKLMPFNKLPFPSSSELVNLKLTSEQIKISQNEGSNNEHFISTGN